MIHGVHVKKEGEDFHVHIDAGQEGMKRCSLTTFEDVVNHIKSMAETPQALQEMSLHGLSAEEEEMLLEERRQVGVEELSLPHYDLQWELEEYKLGRDEVLSSLHY